MGNQKRNREPTLMVNEDKTVSLRIDMIEGNKYYCPDNFNNLNVGWYLNESKENPNVRCDDNYDFYALRDIKKDEELTVDYATFSEYPH